jgi:hypothetical protein
MDALLPDFLDLSRGAAGEAGYADAGLYLALRGWPAPGRASEPLSLRRAPASVVWAQGARLLLRALLGQLTSNLCASRAGCGACIKVHTCRERREACMQGGHGASMP